jgi:colanic acid/amylovoran biosynthesis protein
MSNIASQISSASPSPSNGPARPQGAGRETRRRFGLLGAPIGIGNRGVSALGASTIRLVRDAIPGTEFSLLIGDRLGGHRRILVGGTPVDIPVIPYRMSPRSSLSSQIWWIMLLSILYRILPFSPVRSAIRRRNLWVRTIAEVDFVADIRGGDSFSDIYGVKQFVLGCLPALSVVLIRGSIDQLPQTYGPFRHGISKFFARYILKRSRRILARDAEGPSAVQSLLGSERKVTVCPDVAFCLEPVASASPAIVPPLPSPGTKTIVGINVNGLMYNGGYTRANMFGLKLDYPDFLKRLIAQFLEDPTVHILLVPHTFAPPNSVESDPEASRLVMASVPDRQKERVHLVTRDYDQHEIKGIIGLCDFFVGSRMHACIAALSQAVPCIGVAYSKKFLGVFGSVGMEDWVVDGRDTDAATAVNVVQKLFHSRTHRREPLRQRVDAAQSRLRETFRDLLLR